MTLILVTGSRGLVGSELVTRLEGAGLRVRRFDIGYPIDCQEYGDVLDFDSLRRATHECTGIIHLAAVSRVVWGECNPRLCWSVNVLGTKNVLQAALESPFSPWVVVASSREVYGEPLILPCDESHERNPINVYGYCKAVAENLFESLRTSRLRGAIVRLSNVYGSPTDHPDRVVPAFARLAAAGVPLRIEGSDRTFDFTHVRDVARGLHLIVKRLVQRDPVPSPIQLVSGQGTTLRRLAGLAVQAGGCRSEIVEAAARGYDVKYFVGNPWKARAYLHWEATTSIDDGIGELVDLYRCIDRPPPVSNVEHVPYGTTVAGVLSPVTL